MRFHNTRKYKHKKVRKTYRHRKYGGVNNNNMSGYNSNQLSVGQNANNTDKYIDQRDDLINILTDIHMKFEEIISTNPNFELYENQFINFIESFNEKAIQIDNKLGNNDMQDMILQRVQDITMLFEQYANNNATVVN